MKDENLYKKLKEELNQIKLENNKLRSEKEQFEKESQRLKALISNLQIGIIVESCDRKIIDVNETFCKLFEIPKSEIIINSSCESITQSVSKIFIEQQNFIEEINKILKVNKTILKQELELIDGRVFERTFIPIQHKDKYKSSMWLYKDITKRKNYFEKLFNFFENAPIPYQSLDINGNLIIINNKWCEETGYTKEEVLKRPFTDFLTTPSKLLFLENFPKLIEFGKSEKIVFEIICKNGNVIKTLYEGCISKTKDGEFSHTNCVWQNITEKLKSEQALIKSEEQLRELNATKDKLFSIIAHDLRSPFNGILGFSKMAMDAIKVKQYNKIEKFCQLVNQSSQQSLNLLNNLLQWSRIQTGKMEFVPQIIDLKLIIENTVEFLKTNLKEKQIELIISVEPNLEIFADSFMLETIIRNLVSNAIKFTKNSGKINIISKKNNSEVQIEIRDTGVGISNENINKIFKIEENFSAHGTNKEKGTGLGLILCKEFIDKHKGKIWAESEEGKGSNFIFTIPEKEK